MESETHPRGTRCPISDFVRETVRYRDHFMSRNAAMEWERFLTGDIERVTIVGCLPSEDMTTCPVQIMTDDQAFAVLKSEADAREPLLHLCMV